ncbi:MAG: DNA polymerase III subunit gamma/tau [Solobacterium sp.]|nr:DNA polymerase III subunit gamma/tau [Solobacterium sp.]
MAKTALYQKYRSSTFDEVVGQEYIVRSIQNAIRQDKVGHAYLFCGPRGTGKTTMARLLAKSVNCEHPEIAPCGKCENCIAAMNGTHPDIIEINAANETHVEDIRDLIERSRLAPMQGLHKVYIIDEVHQLSSAASSALLKTLEEPPENVIFILATTDPQKLLPTIISRCQRYDFTKVRKDQIRDHLLSIAEKENIKMDAKAAEMIAVLSDGGMRDALSIMDQCASYTNDDISEEAIDRIYGLATTEEKISLIKNMLACNLEEILTQTKSYEEKGIDFQRFTDGCIDILKDIVVYQKTGKEQILKVLTKEQALDLGNLASSSVYMSIAERLLDTKDRYRLSISAANCFEVIILSITIDLEEPKTTQIVQQVSEPVKQIKQEEKPVVEEPVIEKKENKTYSVNDIVRILVLCDKVSKSHDEEVFRNLSSMMDLENRKYTTLLNDTKIAASGKDCILLLCRAQAVANRINDPEMNKELYYFLKEKCNLDKMIFAITEQAFKEASSEFRALWQVNSLPDGMNIEKYQTEEVKEKTPEEKIIELFGKDNVEII